MNYIVYVWINLAYLAWETRTTNAGWGSSPGTVDACEGQDVVFPWTYVEDPSNPIMGIYWIFLGNGSTLAHWQTDREFTGYGMYNGRVEYPDTNNAGIILLDVSAADAGLYKVELAGPGVTDIAQLNVHTVDDPIYPVVLVDGIMANNPDIQPSSDLQIHTIRDNITVHTAPGGSSLADVTIVSIQSGQPVVLTSCHVTASCTYYMDQLDGTNDQLGDLTIHVEYQACPAQTVTIATSNQASPASDQTALIVGIVVGCIVVVILVILIVLYRKPIRNYHHNLKNDKDRKSQSEIEMEPLETSTNTKKEDRDSPDGETDDNMIIDDTVEHFESGQRQEEQEKLHPENIEVHVPIEPQAAKEESHIVPKPGTLAGFKDSLVAYIFDKPVEGALT